MSFSYNDYPFVLKCLSHIYYRSSRYDWSKFIRIKDKVGPYENCSCGLVFLSSVIIQRHTDKPILKHLPVGSPSLLVNVNHTLQSMASGSAVAVALSLLFEEICTISGSLFS